MENLRTPNPDLTPEAAARLEALNKKEYSDSIYGDADNIPADEEAKKKWYQQTRQRLHEASAYEKHLEKLAGNPTIDYDDEAKAAKARRETLDIDAINADATTTHNLEWEDAIADDEAFNQSRNEALEEKFAKSPTLRRMQNISQEIADIRDTKVTASNDKELQERLKKREDALNELLVAYEASDDYDEAIADMLMDPSDGALRNVAANKALHEKGQPAPADKSEKGKVDENDPASQALNLLSAWNDPEAREGIKEDPEKLKALSEELAKLQKELDEAAKAADEAKKKTKTLKNWGGGLSALQDPKETREDESAHHFVEGMETAHGQAIPINEEFDAYVKAKEEELDKTRVHDKDKAWDEALKIQEERRLKDWDDAIEEDRGKPSVRRPGLPTPPPAPTGFLAGARERTRSLVERRGRLGTRAAKALGVIALAGGALWGGNALFGNHNGPEHVDSGTSASANPNAGSNEAKAKVTEAKPKSAHEKLLESSAWNIPQGGGGEQMMNRLHVDKGVWYANEAEFLKEHPDEAYRMSDGHVGFSDPGKLSMNSIKFWADKVEHQNQK